MIKGNFVLNLVSLYCHLYWSKRLSTSP